MALARIITRSHQYAQKLALDLLARGYTVEVVSPDAIPMGPADLELRVEAYGTEGQGQITEVRQQGKPAKSIEYLQRLKPMMADLLRRWPGNAAAKPRPENRAEFNFNAEAEHSDDVKLPSSQHQSGSEAPELTSPARMSSEEAESAESARLISPASADGQQKRPASAPSIFSITGEPISWAESEPESTGRSEVWFWRAAVGFACIALIILVLGMALRKNPSAPAQAAVPAPTQTVAPTQSLRAPAAPKPSAASVAPLPVKAAVIPAVTPVAAVASAKPSAAVHRTRAGQNNEIVSGDTTVTYFNAKAAEPSKAAASQGPGIKHYSDLD